MDEAGLITLGLLAYPPYLFVFVKNHVSSRSLSKKKSNCGKAGKFFNVAISQNPFRGMRPFTTHNYYTVSQHCANMIDDMYHESKHGVSEINQS